MEENSKFDVDDPRYRITPTQQMLSSCFGAVTTSVMGKYLLCNYSYIVLMLHSSHIYSFLFRIVTPLDVVKIRLQAQQNAMPSHRCFIYCNGLMDHCIICVNGQVKTAGTVFKQQWYKRPGHFSGTIVH